MARCDAAAGERTSRLAVERQRLAIIDEQKRQFASAAEAVVDFVKGERATLEAKTPPSSIHQDHAEEIADGKAKLAYLNEYSTASGERAARLASARELSDALLAVGEIDNPYTRQTMASLKGQVDMLEKLARDKVNFLEGQLARAQADITPEQHAELKEAFEHFDKSGDFQLNQLEFVAAMKSLDFEDDSIASEFTKYADGAKGADGEASVSFDAFVTIVLQQYKDKDTMDGLLAAFRTLANGKDALPADALAASLKPTDAEFLQAKLAPSADGNGLDYASFTKAVYGDSAAPVS